jgi:hypothetical protein
MFCAARRKHLALVKILELKCRPSSAPSSINRGDRYKVICLGDHEPPVTASGCSNMRDAANRVTVLDLVRRRCELPQVPSLQLAVVTAGPKDMF